MTVHTPFRCSNSVMSQFPTGSIKVVLVDNGNYPAFSNYLNTTWVFNGTDWSQVSTTLIDPGASLPGRADACMAYDGTNVVMYGGRASSSLTGVLQDTWVFNGTTWVQRTPATVPYGRYKAELAYLAGTGAVMFGGRTVNDMLLETWIWNGTTWSQVVLANGASPPARVDHCMDGGGGQVILFGGAGTNQQFNDTWSFNGTTWTKLAPATSPSIRSMASMAYSIAGGVWVMFGGQNAKNYLAETWVFNGTTWTQVSIGAGPSGRINAQMAYDSVTGKIILFGGVSATLGADSANETWSFNALTNTWAQL